MLTSVKKKLRRLPLHHPSSEIEMGYLSQNGWVLMGDLSQNQKLKNLSRSQGSTLLFLQGTGRDQSTKHILKGMMQWIFEKNNRLIHSQPLALRYLLQQFLLQKRNEVDIARFQGYALINNQLYSLNEGATSQVFIFRQGTLLEFQVEPHHFIPIDPQDVVLLTSKALVDLLLQQGLLPLFKDSHPLTKGLQAVYERLIAMVAEEGTASENEYPPILVLRHLPSPAAPKRESLKEKIKRHTISALAPALIGGGLLLALCLLLLFL